MGNAIQDRAEKVSSHIINQINKMFALEEGKYGPEAVEAFEMHFVACYLSYLVTKSLNSAPKTATDKVKYDTVSVNFSGKKVLIQESVAAAFSSAMTRFSGQDVDYYCKITALPEAPKLTC